MTSDAESDFPNEDLDSDVGAVLDELSLENIRQISKNITIKFGARSDREDEDSDAVWRQNIKYFWEENIFQEKNQ